MTGAGQTYEAPLKADLHLDGTQPVVDNTRTLMDWIMSRRAR
jgi:adenylylsulfate kinase-like enzyme